MGSCFKGSISIHSMASSVIQTYSLVVKKMSVTRHPFLLRIKEVCFEF